MTRLARAVSQRSTRVLATWLLLLGCASDEPKAALTTTGVACLDGTAPCADECVRLASSAAHCGACDNACGADSICDRSVCKPADEGCSGALSVCGGGCVDTRSANEHCGACGQACAPEGDCNGGVCTCPGQLAACGSSCVDTQLDEKNCGGCNTSCFDTQSCDAGVCRCPEGQELCGTTCVDLLSNAQHCSSCDAACATGQICTGGECACPAAQTVCGDACVDTQTSTAHCGSCDSPCSGDQVCDAGVCVCPEGFDFCDDRCIDTRVDDLNCGTCGNECGLGDGCAGSTCQSGAPGEDGCQGLAQNLSISEIAAYQTVKTELVRGGANVNERSIELVAGRPTLLRVLVNPGAGWMGRELSARLHLQNGETISRLYSESTLSITEASSEADRESAFEFRVPAERITDETRYAVEVVECSVGAGETLQPRFPETDGVSLNAIDTGGLRVHVIPLRANGRLPDTSAQALGIYESAFLATYPISGIEFTVGEPLNVADAEDWNTTLDMVRALRQAEDPDPEVYYYGMMQPAETLRAFCGTGCTAGVGYVPDDRFGLSPNARAAVGLAYADAGSAFTMLHEVAHNHGRGHAPCVQGGTITGVDADFPYDDGSIGVYGYNSLGDELISPNAASDIMGYCRDQWLSDYTYGGLLDAVLSVNQVQASLYVTPERIGAWRVVMVDPVHGARWGIAIPTPTLASGAEELALAVDAAGAPIETVSVYRTQVADLDSFSIQVPEPKAGWHAIEVAGAPPIPYR